jgi:hypothetical protein
MGEYVDLPDRKRKEVVKVDVAWVSSLWFLEGLR